MPTDIQSAPIANAVWLSLDAIEASPYQPRRAFDESELRELADSIKEHGVIQPIVVRAIKGKTHKGIAYQLVGGERRWRASEIAGKTQIPAIVRELSDLEVMFLALIENDQRKDLSDYEKATQIRNIFEYSEKNAEPLSERSMAKQLGKSVSYVRNAMQLFKLKPDVQEIAQRHANVKSSLFLINPLPDGDRAVLLKCVDKGASFKDIEREVERVKADIAWKAESRSAPDTETQQRQSQHENGGGQMSRGKLVTGSGNSEARKEATRLVGEIESALVLLNGWIDRAPEVQTELSTRLNDVARRAQKLAR